MNACAFLKARLEPEDGWELVEAELALGIWGQISYQIVWRKGQPYASQN